MNGYRLLSLLLQYPDEELLAGRAELEQALAELPECEVRSGIALLSGVVRRRRARRAAGRLRRHVRLRPPGKPPPHLPPHGDRRQRGIELVRLKRRFAAADLALADGELPDYLPALLEFAALAPEGQGVALLAEHRAALEPRPQPVARGAAAVTRRCSTRSPRRCPR